MPRTITDPANTNYDFGQDFDYSVWPKGTQIDLVNVPWNNDYRDIVKFPDQNSLNAYIDSIKGAGISLGQMSYVKPNTPIKINIPFNRANEYNYVRVSNPIQPIPGEDKVKYFYYFILDVKYNAPNTTELTLQVDVVQTYIWNCKFGNCYVERGHIGIANANSFTNFGRDYLTVPEGFDLGSEYVSGKGETTTFGYGVVVAISTVDLDADPGTVESPNLVSAKGTSFIASEGDNLNPALSFGASAYYWASATKFKQFLDDYADKPWVTQGIIGVYSMPPLQWFGGINGGPADTTESPNYHGYSLDGFQFQPSLTYMWAGWRFDDRVTKRFPDRYKNLRKFFTFPYMAIELTTWTGKPIILKPESWQDQDGYIVTRGSFGTTQNRLEISPANYNHNNEPFNPPSEIMPYYNGGDYFDTATYISDFPSLPIVNNGAIAYLASNKNSIAFQHTSADWSQQRALGMNQATYDIASGGIETSKLLTDIANMGAGAQTGIANSAIGRQAVNNAIASVAGGAASGAGMASAGAGGLGAAGLVSSGVSAIASGINTGIQMSANEQATAAGNLTRTASTALSNRQEALVRDTNKNVSDWAARGDYANQIAAVNAKVRDAALIQPTVSGQLGGDFASVLNGTGYVVTMIVKTLQPASMRVVGEYWLRYGYAIHAFMTMPDSLMVMEKMTYWKLAETYITASKVPEGFKQAIRGIFEKGVTVWADPSYIGNIDFADNAPLKGISY